jgi:hypothetical protein
VVSSDDEMQLFVAPPAPPQEMREFKISHFTVEPPRTGPGRGIKKRGPGRPSKKRSEETPGYCPEFLEPSLLVDMSVPQSENKRTELVYHYHHVDAYHTQYETPKDMLIMPRQGEEKEQVSPSL